MAEITYVTPEEMQSRSRFRHFLLDLEALLAKPFDAAAYRGLIIKHREFYALAPQESFKSALKGDHELEMEYNGLKMSYNSVL